MSHAARGVKASFPVGGPDPLVPQAMSLTQNHEDGSCFNEMKSIFLHQRLRHKRGALQAIDKLKIVD
ncbi:hypothetical protein BS627_18560 [Agrobacterium salinitolerans]|nr:hypothetical protein BS627_18560 [Agrobacterium salinitolerans]PNQ21268.1 hypothetical protein C2E26_18870 [Rhizobium sp. YIC5082]